MKTRIRSIFTKRRLLLFLIAMLLVPGIVFNQAPQAGLAWREPDPDDGIGGIGTPDFEAPVDGFAWDMVSRYGLDRNGDGMTDTYWIKTLQKYDETYVYPNHWTVRLDGCQTEYDLENPANTMNTYTWQIVGDPTPIANSHTCLFQHDFDAQGAYTVRLTIHDPDGNIIPAGRTDPEYFQQDVTIRDILIVSLGDSYASGEGNPDVQQVVEPHPWPIPGWHLIHEAKWQDDRCHRSAFSGPSLAAMALEYADPHTSVTFISFACSGATLMKDNWEFWDANKPLGSGILGPYRGLISEEDLAYSDTFVGYIDSQMEQLRRALIPPAGHDPRQIDALIISAGGNDMHFGNILLTCLAAENCWDNSVRIPENTYTGNSTPLYTLENLIQRALGHWGDQGPAITLPESFAALHSEINLLQPAPPAHVYLTQYPNMTRNTGGDHCPEIMEDVFWPDTPLSVNHWEIYEAEERAMGPLNTHIKEAAQLYQDDGWQFVDGLSVYDVDPTVQAGTLGLFALGHDGQGHGYCASNNWIRRAEESELIQGPVNLRPLTRGTMHPNVAGHMAIKERLLRYMVPDLAVHGDQAPPAFTFSYELEGYSDVASETGWYLESCNDQICQPKIVAQAVATSTLRLDGAGVSVNGVDGCAIEGVTCEIPASTDETQVTYEVEITASGTYQFRFIAQDSSGQASSLEQEIKVDLEGPALVTPIEPFEVQEGGSVILTTTATSPGEAVFDYDWDLDNDGEFETTDEQPVFSAASLDGPASQTIQVKATDRAGRTATAPATVNVLNVAPTAAINSTPATSAEGTAINLTSSVTDPGTADTFTYEWLVKKDGVDYANGTNADLSFTPDDNGSYEVSLSVTDDDGDVGAAASQTIAVTNVAPALSNLSVPSTGVNEGASLTLTGDITEPGTADTLALTIDWADGSTQELVSLPAGSTSFTLTHTYADDDPTGTASDIYQIALTIDDDDDGTGTASVSVVVNNLAPSLSILSPESGALYAVNTAVDLSASLLDPSSLDTLTCSVSWGDGAAEFGALSAGVCTASHIYTAAGVYTIQMTGTDDDTGTKTESLMVVVYDPSAGFVTGGGWIDSPAGAYQPDESLAGKATFGFVSRYQKGASVPTGNTAFEFEVGNLEFHSNAYEWLVVNQAGTNAQFKGSGLINGSLDANGNAYKFMLWAGDGSPDTFRIRIWWEDAAGEHVVYDNNTNPAIGGGNIVIHSK